MVYDWAWSELASYPGPSGETEEKTQPFSPEGPGYEARSEHGGSESELELSDHENTDVESIIGIEILYS